MDKSIPITLIGGELGYDFVNSVDNSYKTYGVKINPKNNNIVVYGDSSKITIYNTGLPVVKELIVHWWGKALVLVRWGLLVVVGWWGIFDVLGI